MFQSPLDMLTFEVFEAEGCVPAIPNASPCPELAGKMLHTHRGLPPAQDEGSLEHVAHFAHIAGPRIRQQTLEHFSGQRRGSIRQLSPKIPHQASYEGEPVFS